MNNNLRILIGTIVAVIVLTVPLFLLPVDGMLIVAYIFALAGVFALAGTLFWGCNRSRGEYVTTAAFPLAAASYLGLDLLLSVIFILLKVWEIYALPAGWFFFLHILLAGFFVWKLLGMDAGKEQIEAIGAKVEQKTSNWRLLRSEAAVLGSSAAPDIRKEISAVQDAFRYADPVSLPELEELDQAIRDNLNRLKQLVGDGKNDEIPGICTVLLRQIKEREIKAKALK